MTEREAIKELREVMDTECQTESQEKAYNMAIKALEKQIPYKPQEYEDKYYGCKCGNILLHKWLKYPTELMPKSEGLPYCLACGQKLDWE